MFWLHFIQRVAWPVLFLLVLCASLPSCASASIHSAPVGALMLPAGARATPTIPPAVTRNVVRPTRLLIPTIGVNAPIESVGIDASGNLATPALKPWEDTGWYERGPLPGARGSAVIDGHLDRPGGSPAVFWNLRQLRVGDLVKIDESNGNTLRFRVIDGEYYQPQNAPLQLIFGDASGTYLNLITCAGDWIPGQHQTTLRLVIYTQKI